MTRCNYIPLDTANLDAWHPLFDELLDLDVLATEEGIFINVPEQE
jgi:hypothetical protein